MGKLLTSLDEYKTYMEDQATTFQRIGQAAMLTNATLQGDFTNWTTGDVRLAYFAQINNHCRTIVYTLIAMADCLPNPEWHKKRYLGGNVGDLKILIEETDKSLKTNAFLRAWALTENAIRRIRTTLKNVPASGSIVKHCEALLECPEFSRHSGGS